MQVLRVLLVPVTRTAVTCVNWEVARTKQVPVARSKQGKVCPYWLCFLGLVTDQAQAFEV